MARDFEIHREVELPATPEQVWEAITTREGLSAWLFDQDVPDSAAAEVWEPPRRLVIRLPEAPDGATQAFEYEIEARAGGHAVLRFVHSGFLGESWDAEFDFGEATGHGWDMYLHTLAEYLAHFAGRRARYVDVQAPRSSVGEGAWARLMAALGVPGDLAAGDAVRLAPEGVGVIEGVADYVAPGYFLGLRTSDALIRFHGRGPMGLPIAVAVHAFAADADPDRIRTVWGALLERVFD